nr:hypothetical protein [Pseudomonas huaxiensis]
MTRLAQLSLLAAILVSAGCAHHHHHDRNDGWRGDRDQRRWQDDRRDHRYDNRYDHRRDDRRYRDDD